MADLSLVPTLAVLLLCAHPLLMFAAIHALFGVARLPQRVTRAAGAIAVVALATYAGVVLAYLAGPEFFDNFEVTIACVAARFARGGEVYHAGDAPYCYSVLYGPFIYIIQRASLALVGPGVTAVKLPSVAGALLALTLLGWTLAAVTTRGRALWLTGLSAVALLAFGPQSYTARADPPMLFCVVLSLAGAVRAPRALAVALVGAGLGVTANIKPTAAVYSLVALLVLHERAGLASAAAAVALGAAVAVAPYLCPGVSFTDQSHWLKVAVAHGYDWGVLAQNLEWIALLFIPVAGVVLDARRRRDQPPLVPRALAAVGVIALAAGVFASKVGGWTAHLMPVVPLSAYVIARALGRGAELASPVAVRFGAASLCTLLIAGVPFQAKISDDLARRARMRANDDVLEYVAAHPGEPVQIGYSSADNSWLANRRVLLVQRGHPLLVDLMAVLEMSTGGVPVPDAAIRALAADTRTTWLLPPGDPFSMPDVKHPGRPLFPEAFRRAFFAGWQCAGRTRLFDVWRPRDPARAGR